MNRYTFNVAKVSIEKEYIRLISSGFLHISWMHLIVNMIVLFGFGRSLPDASLGLIYFSSMVGGNLLALWIHNHNPAYTSIGASGAVSGLVFATIALAPQMPILFFVPGWVFGVAYVLYTIYAIRSRRTDVGHAAHLGGALIGMVVALMLYPKAIVANWLPILLIFLPALALIFIMIYKPELILIDKRSQVRQLTVDDRANMDIRSRKQEIDRILEKINDRGIGSLSKKERQMLEDYSKQ